ncbi:MAG: hypothetical protein HY646_18420 [Acidobacteria bacterium]|nr:hypothetical protein [Acidobacteriota bacterium]
MLEQTADPPSLNSELRRASHRPQTADSHATRRSLLLGGSIPLRTGPSTKLRTGKLFWRQKLAANIARDRLVNRQLRKAGWAVVRIWEHELGATRGRRSEIKRQRVVRKIRKALVGETLLESFRGSVAKYRRRRWHWQA